MCESSQCVSHRSVVRVCAFIQPTSPSLITDILIVTTMSLAPLLHHLSVVGYMNFLVFGQTEIHGRKTTFSQLH